MNEVKEINMWLDLFSWENVGNVFALLVVAGIVIGFVHAVTSNKNSHSLLDMFLPLGSSKMRINGTWLAAIFILVYLTIKGMLTEGIFGLVLAAFVTDRIFSRKDGNKEEPKKPEVEEK